MEIVEDGAARKAADAFGENGEGTQTIERRLARLEAREAIEELLPHYARCVDCQDAHGVAAAFAEDGALCNPGMPPLAGRARIERLYGKLLPAMRTSSHLIGAQQVLFTGEDAALVHAAFQAWDSYAADDAPDCFSFGFYEAEVKRQPNGQWAFVALSIDFAGQLEAEEGRLRDGVGMNGRFSEQFARPWPPQPQA